MILACTCLHNYLRTDEQLENIHNEIENVTLPYNSILQNIQNVLHEDDNLMEDAMVIRDKFKSYFNSQNVVAN